MGRTEVTQRQWERIMESNPSRFKGSQNPVESVSWHDCQEFIKMLNRQVPGGGFRLPTEAEWEYACRAGTKTAYHWGDNFGLGNCNAENDKGSSEDKQCAHFSRKGWPVDSTMPVGKFDPNAWGLYDMHGNVWEWCEDGHRTYTSSSQTDPRGSSGSSRVLRGGSWVSVSRFCRSANRDGGGPSVAVSHVGFRVVVSR
jgi:formylglycine-generating enzyme required for sulfatase activity